MKFEQAIKKAKRIVKKEGIPCSGIGLTIRGKVAPINVSFYENDLYFVQFERRFSLEDTIFLSNEWDVEQ